MIRKFMLIALFLALLARLGTGIAQGQVSQVVRVEIDRYIIDYGIRLNPPAGSFIVTVNVINATYDETAYDVYLDVAIPPELPRDAISLPKPRLGSIGPDQKAPPVTFTIKYPTTQRLVGTYSVGVGARFKDSSGKEYQSTYISFPVYILPDLLGWQGKVNSLATTMGGQDYTAAKGLVQGLLDLVSKKLEDYYALYEPSLTYIIKIWQNGQDVDAILSKGCSTGFLDSARETAEAMGNTLPLLHSEVIQKVSADPPRGNLLKIFESLSQMKERASAKIEQATINCAEILGDAHKAAGEKAFSQATTAALPDKPTLYLEALDHFKQASDLYLKAGKQVKETEARQRASDSQSALDRVKGESVETRQKADTRRASGEAKYRDGEDNKLWLQKKTFFELAIKEFVEAATLYKSIGLLDEANKASQREKESVSKLNGVADEIKKVEKYYTDGDRALSGALNLRPLKDRLTGYQTAEGLLDNAVKGYATFPDLEKKRKAEAALAEAEKGKANTETEINSNRKKANDLKNQGEEERKLAPQKGFLSTRLESYSLAVKLFKQAVELYETITDDRGAAEARAGIPAAEEGMKKTEELIKAPDIKMNEGRDSMVKGSNEAFLLKRQEHVSMAYSIFQLAQDGYTKIPNSSRRIEAENWLKLAQKEKDDAAGKTEDTLRQANQAIASANTTLDKASNTSVLLETRLASARESESLCGQAGQLYGRLPDENKVRESQEICGKAKVGIGSLEKEIRDAEAAADGLLEKAKADFQSAAKAQALKDALVAYSASGGNFQKSQQTYLRIPRPEKAGVAESQRESAIGKEKETNAEIDKIRNIALELKKQGINHQSSAQRSIIPLLAIPHFNSSLAVLNDALGQLNRIGRDEKEIQEVQTLVNEVSAAVDQKGRETPVWVGGFVMVMVTAFVFWRWRGRIRDMETEDMKIEGILFPRQKG